MFMSLRSLKNNLGKCLCAYLMVAISSILTACGGGGGKGGLVDGVLRPAVTESPYKNDIVACVKTVNYQPQKLCKLSVLPFIGQHASAPTKADILAQTVVSHPWMITRFSQLLDKMPQDIFLLFRGVTAVVIDAKVRPSHYLSETGAIYLDPADLWLETAERDTISRQEDYRSGFSNGLGFRSLWRYMRGNRYAYNYYTLDGEVSTRTIGDIVLPMAELLFHELAHANDFMPPVLVAGINPQLTAADAIEQVAQNALISSLLKAQTPLNSTMQAGLAQVMYRGLAASAEQKALTAAQVGLDFAIDGASDHYAYSSQYEDLAMLFEEVMMLYYFGVDREMAFTDPPPSTGGNCDSYIVRWGVRNRIANEQVKARAQLIVDKVLGVNDSSAYFAYLRPERNRSMTTGVSWCMGVGTAAPVNGIENGAAQKPSNVAVPLRDLLPHH